MGRRSGAGCPDGAARGNSGLSSHSMARIFTPLAWKRSIDATIVAPLPKHAITAYKGVVRPVEGTILTVPKISR